MAEIAEELQEARKEFDLFGAYMKRPEALQTPSEVPSQGSATTGTGTPTQDLTPHPDMEVDREKKHSAPPTGTQETPPKWAKGEAKGDKTDNRADEAFTGKGRAAEPTPAPILATNPQTAPQSASSGANTATRTSQGARQHPPQQPSWRRQGGYQQWPVRRRDRDGDQDERSDTRTSKDLKELREAVKAMGRLSLRMEDALGVIHLDMEYMIFLQTEATGNEFAITQQLYDTAVEWNRMKQEQPESLTNPMRNILLHNLFSALLMKLEALEEDQNLMAKARAKGLIEGSTYVYLQWDHSARKHIKAAAQPLEHQEAVLSVKMLKYLSMYPNVVGRFHALRKMTSESMGSDIIPFSLVAQNRTQEAHQMFTLMGRLSRNSIWHLIGGTARPAKPGRSPLAKYLDRLIQAL